MQQEPAHQPTHLVQYSLILNRFGGPDSKEAKEFVEKHKDEPLFMEKREVLDKFWRLDNAS